LKKQTALRLAQEQHENSNVGLDGVTVADVTAVSNITLVDKAQPPPVVSAQQSKPTVEGRTTIPTTHVTLQDHDLDIAKGDVTDTTAPTLPITSASTASSGIHRSFWSSSAVKQQRSLIPKSQDNSSLVSEKKLFTPSKPAPSSNNGFFFSRSCPTAQIQPTSSCATTGTTTSPMKHQPRSLFATSSSSERSGSASNNNTTSCSTHSNSRHSTTSNVILSRTAIDVSTATEKGSNAKLPHGLTVSELKEMTKARLQAEATNINTQTTAMMEHNNNHGRAFFSTVNHSTNATSPVPSRRSPYPTTYDTSETWETTSLSTACTSEFLFSNGAVPESTNTTPIMASDHDDGFPFTRSISYPDASQQHSLPIVMTNPSHNGSMYPSQHHPTDLSLSTFRPQMLIGHSNQFSDYNVPQQQYNYATSNRCRAATSSPRLGTPPTEYHMVSQHQQQQQHQYNGATFTFEDPYHHNFQRIHSDVVVDETLLFPDGNTTMNNDRFQDRNQYTSSNMDGSTTFSSGYYQQHGYAMNITDSTPHFYESNRSRTVSLPTLTPNAIHDGPCMDGNTLNNVHREKLAKAPKVLVAGLSDAFQSPQTSSYSYSSGFDDSMNDNKRTSFMAAAVDDGFGMINMSDQPSRYRAATWTHTASPLLLFGSIGRDSTTVNNMSASIDLSDDLASILKLSTAPSVSSSSSSSQPTSDQPGLTTNTLF
jgi:hypothetical protein